MSKTKHCISPLFSISVSSNSSFYLLGPKNLGVILVSSFYSHPINPSANFIDYLRTCPESNKLSPLLHFHSSQIINLNCCRSFNRSSCLICCSNTEYLPPSIYLNHMRSCHSSAHMPPVAFHLIQNNSQSTSYNFQGLCGLVPNYLSDFISFLYFPFLPLCHSVIIEHIMVCFFSEKAGCTALYGPARSGPLHLPFSVWNSLSSVVT